MRLDAPLWWLSSDMAYVVILSPLQPAEAVGIFGGLLWLPAVHGVSQRGGWSHLPFTSPAVFIPLLTRESSRVFCRTRCWRKARSMLSCSTPGGAALAPSLRCLALPWPFPSLVLPGHAPSCPLCSYETLLLSLGA